MDVFLSPLRISELEVLIENAVGRVLAKFPQASPAQQQDKIYDKVEAAEYLGTAESTIYSLVRDGKLSSCKPGRRLYFLKADLDDYIKRSRRRSDADISQHLDTNLSNVA